MESPALGPLEISRAVGATGAKSASLTAHVVKLQNFRARQSPVIYSYVVDEAVEKLCRAGVTARTYRYSIVLCFDGHRGG